MPRSGITYSPELEWIAAAVWAHYRPDDEPGGFFSLDGERQSMIVAAYETEMQIEAVTAQEQMRQAQVKANRKR